MFFIVGDVPVSRDSMCPRTDLSFITSARKRLGYEVVTEKGVDGQRVYCIA